MKAKWTGNFRAFSAARAANSAPLGVQVLREPSRPKLLVCHDFKVRRPS